MRKNVLDIVKYQIDWVFHEIHMTHMVILFDIVYHNKIHKASCHVENRTNNTIDIEIQWGMQLSIILSIIAPLQDTIVTNKNVHYPMVNVVEHSFLDVKNDVTHFL
jgi:hypothetical protein